MAQVRIHDYKGWASSTLLNQRWFEAVGNVVLNGFDVLPGSFGLRVTIRAGAGLIGGVTVVETEDQVDVLTLSPAPTQGARIDVIALSYAYQQFSPPPTATFIVVSGTPSSTPQPPTLSPNHLKLAEIYVEAGMNVLTPERITNAPKFRDRIQDLIPRGALTLRKQPFYVEGKIWVRDTAPPQNNLQKGDFWVDTSAATIRLLLWNGTNWIDLLNWASLRGVPNAFPPAVHELAGEKHSGNLPITRVSGHTAFGPAAHQEIFAACVLRRP